MTNPRENPKVRVVTRFLRQETSGIRGKNTCFVTSVVNTAIALGAVTTEEAQRLHPLIINQLITVPELWNGSVQRIQTHNPRIAEIIEESLPIRMGFDSEIGRLILVPRTFGELWRDLVTKGQTYVITVSQAVHAYAIVGARLEREGKALTYIDPLNPYIAHVGTEQWFNKTFQPDNHGWINATPIRERVRVLG